VVSELTLSGKPFDITKSEVWEAYEQVKANKGAPGVDKVNLVEFEKDLKGNLYKIWNRCPREAISLPR
jgi:RNA-directed DNA polymerase